MKRVPEDRNRKKSNQPLKFSKTDSKPVRELREDRVVCVFVYDVVDWDAEEEEGREEKEEEEQRGRE